MRESISKSQPDTYLTRNSLVLRSLLMILKFELDLGLGTTRKDNLLKGIIKHEFVSSSEDETFFILIFIGTFLYIL